LGPVPIEAGFIYTPSRLDTVGGLTDDDVKELSDTCEVCGKPIKHIKNAVVDVNEHLHPICIDCELDLRAGLRLRDMMVSVGVGTVDEFLRWIEFNRHLVDKPEFMR